MWYALAQSQTMMHRDEFCHESPSNAKAQIVIDRLLNGMWGEKYGSIQIKIDAHYVISFKLFWSIKMSLDMISSIPRGGLGLGVSINYVDCVLNIFDPFI